MKSRISAMNRDDSQSQKKNSLQQFVIPSQRSSHTVKEYERVVLPSFAGVLNGLSYFFPEKLSYKTSDPVASTSGAQYQSDVRRRPLSK